MKKMKKKYVFASIFVLSLTLLIIAMPYILGVAVKSSASAVDGEIGTISYYKADLFNYEPSKRSENGNFLLGRTEYTSDATLFLFNQEKYEVDPVSYGMFVIPKPSEHNSWISDYKYKVARGLVDNGLGEGDSITLANSRIAVSGTNGVKLFDKTDITTYRGAYSFPFENVGDGCWEYDSSKNHVEVTSDVDTDGLLKMKRYDGTSSYGFMPFNKLDTSSGEDENGYYALSGNKDFYFGLKVEVPFVMPKNGKVTTHTGEEADMIFTYTGDDEVWVYLDSELILDLGGVHNEVSGMINFATGVVSTTGNQIDENTGRYNEDVTTVMIENTSIKTLSVGRHKLQVFYLERDGEMSNCKVAFRLQEDQTPEETIEPLEELVGPSEEVPEEEMQ